MVEVGWVVVKGVESVSKKRKSAEGRGTVIALGPGAMR